jgi:ribulokinase
LAYLIGTDIGTMGTKTVLVDAEGTTHAEAFHEYGVITPKQGWAEQWPDPWLNATYKTIQQVITKSKINAKDIAGVSISALYGGSGIPVDKNYQAVRPCIIWADRRATIECRWVREKINENELYKITGNVIDPYYGYTKILWIKHNEPEKWAKIRRLETPNAYVIRSLTESESIDFSSAGNIGGIFDLEKRDWSDELLHELGIPRNLFPETIKSSDEIVGEITSEASTKTGLLKGTPVCAGGIDAPVSALAGGAIMEGDLASMLGTSMCNGLITSEDHISPKMINYPYVVKGDQNLYSFTGISTAGFCVRWFRDQYGQSEIDNEKKTGTSAYKLLDESAEAIPIGSDELIFLPHMMVGERAPYWDEHLRGAFLGLTVFHTKAHMFRAILEGVAYAMRYSVDAARDTGVKINRATLVDGGASSHLWRQIIADATEITYHFIPDTLGAPMGDAMLAGLGTGEITNYKAIEDWIKNKMPTEPIKENVEIYKKYYKLYTKSVIKLSSIFAEL